MNISYIPGTVVVGFKMNEKLQGDGRYFHCPSTVALSVAIIADRDVSSSTCRGRHIMARYHLSPFAKKQP